MWFKANPGTTSVSAEGQTFTPNSDGFFEAPDELQTALTVDGHVHVEAPLNPEAQSHIGPKDQTKTAAEEKEVAANAKPSAVTEAAIAARGDKPDSSFGKAEEVTEEKKP
jgi:hypothetical protein